MNKKELTTKYKEVNNIINDYIDKWKIKPTRLKKYLKPGSKRFENFLNRNSLTPLDTYSIILKDVIEDRVSMEKDNILTFESYKIFESNIEDIKQYIYNGLDLADIKMEKVLADKFDTNLSDISIKDAEKHIFNVDSWNGESKVVIFSNEDIEIIKENIFNYLYQKVENKKIELIENISINLSEIVDEKIFYNKIEKIFDRELTFSFLSDLLNLEYKGKFNNHFIWY